MTLSFAFAILLMFFVLYVTDRIHCKPVDLQMAVQKDSSCLKTLDLQLSEVDMLISMFPDQEEFKLDDPCAVAEVKSYVEGNMSYDELQSRIGFTLNLHSKSQVQELY